MLKGFRTKELVFIALMAALAFIIALVLGVGINAITATPMLGGLVINLFFAFLLVLFALIIRKFGAIILLTLIYSLLSVPTINLGPPGFYKILIAVFIGLFMEIVLLVGQRKKIAYYMAVSFGFVLAIPLMIWIMNFLGLPGVDKLAPIMSIVMIIYFIEGIIGSWLAFIAYDKKLKNSALVKRLTS